MFLYEEIKQSNQFKLKDFPVFFNDKKCLKVIEKIIDQKGKILNFYIKTVYNHLQNEYNNNALRLTK